MYPDFAKAFKMDSQCSVMKLRKYGLEEQTLKAAELAELKGSNYCQISQAEGCFVKKKFWLISFACFSEVIQLNQHINSFRQQMLCL